MLIDITCLLTFCESLQQGTAIWGQHFPFNLTGCEAQNNFFPDTNSSKLLSHSQEVLDLLVPFLTVSTFSRHISAVRDCVKGGGGGGGSGGIITAPSKPKRMNTHKFIHPFFVP